MDFHVILDQFRRPDLEYAKLQLVDALWARCFINILFRYRISWTPFIFGTIFILISKRLIVVGLTGLVTILSGIVIWFHCGDLNRIRLGEIITIITIIQL